MPDGLQTARDPIVARDAFRVVIRPDVRVSIQSLLRMFRRALALFVRDAAALKRPHVSHFVSAAAIADRKNGRESNAFLEPMHA
jgi:hypothetical protein